jgi:hypothetical protein
LAGGGQWFEQIAALHYRTLPWHIDGLHIAGEYQLHLIRLAVESWPGSVPAHRGIYDTTCRAFPMSTFLVNIAAKRRVMEKLRVQMGWGILTYIPVAS